MEMGNNFITYTVEPLNRPPLGPVKVSLLKEWPHFRDELVFNMKHALGLIKVA